MKQITKLDHNQVIKRSFNEEENSLDVSLKNLEIAIELDAADGDSVQTVKKSQVFKSDGNVTEFELDISLLEKIQVYANAEHNLEISPDGETYFPFGSNPATGPALSVMGQKLKITSSQAQQIIVVGK
jgi:hypothetical protein